MMISAMLVLLLQQAVEAGNTMLSTGDFEGAVKAFTRGIDDKTQGPAALRGRGDAWFRLGEFEKAEQDYTAAQARKAGADLLARRGMARLRGKGLLAAAPDFEEALTLNSKCAEAIAGKAELLLGEGQVVEAEKLLDQALSLSPDLPQALYIRSVIHSLGGDPASSLEDLDRAIAKDPFHIEARRARVMIRLAGEDLDKALKDLDELVRLRPKSDEFYALRGGVQVQAKHVEAALGDLSRAVELNPKSVDHLLRRAAFFRRQLKDNARSAADYTRALQLEPANTDALTGRGYAYVRLKEFHSAGRDLARACELAPDDPWGPYNLACFHGLRAAELKDAARAKAADDAFRWLQEAREAGYLKLACGCHGSTLEHLRTDSDLDALHEDKRWKAASQPDEDD